MIVRLQLLLLASVPCSEAAPRPGILSRLFRTDVDDDFDADAEDDLAVDDALRKATEAEEALARVARLADSDDPADQAELQKAADEVEEAMERASRAYTNLSDRAKQRMPRQGRIIGGILTTLVGSLLRRLFGKGELSRITCTYTTYGSENVVLMNPYPILYPCGFHLIVLWKDAPIRRARYARAAGPGTCLGRKPRCYRISYYVLRITYVRASQPAGSSTGFRITRARREGIKYVHRQPRLN